VLKRLTCRTIQFWWLCGKMIRSGGSDRCSVTASRRFSRCAPSFHSAALPDEPSQNFHLENRLGSPPSSSSSTSVTVTTLPRDSSRGNVSAKEPGTGKSSAHQESGSGDVEGEPSRCEILFLGRQDDNIYLCERDGETAYYDFGKSYQ
jgi:hypothetical protein